MWEKIDAFRLPGFIAGLAVEVPLGCSPCRFTISYQTTWSRVPVSIRVWSKKHHDASQFTSLHTRGVKREELLQNSSKAALQINKECVQRNFFGWGILVRFQLDLTFLLLLKWRACRFQFRQQKNNITRILFCSSIFVSLKEKMLSRVGNLKWNLSCEELNLFWN